MTWNWRHSIMRLDESNRIKRYQTKQAYLYLAQQKGEEYIKYRNDWEYYCKHQIVPDRPLQLNLEITSRCNLKCKMCFKSYSEIQQREGELSLEDINLLMNQAEKLQIPSIWLSGGEPTLHPYFSDIIKTVSNVNPLDFWVVTNGTNLTDSLIADILSSKITWLSISIDAFYDETYKRIRKGELETVKRGVLNFLERRNERKQRLPFLRVSYIEMNENLGEMNDFIRFWQDKADIIDVQSLADYHKLEEITDIESIPFKCTAPFSLLSVTPNGNIIPCCNGFYKSSSKHNIKDISIVDYWNSDFHEMFAKSIKDKKYSSECLKCVKSFAKRD